nr:helix-turn-helix domain-containing protein [Halococcus agarilyticus]
MDDLGPSAKLVFRVLDYEGPLTQRELAELTLLSQRTVRKALRRLLSREVIDERLYVPDGRQRLYEIHGRRRDREE